MLHIQNMQNSIRSAHLNGVKLEPICHKASSQRIRCTFNSHSLLSRKMHKICKIYLNSHK